jgi:zeta-carotene desaturase
MTMAREELASLAVAEMKKYFRAAADAKVVHTQVIKERKATVLLTPSLAGLRPGSDIGLKNCFLAGDWTDTGLPATMESAVKSGFTAAEMV